MLFNIGTLFALLMAVTWPATARAYIDPGTGSILIQGIIAAIAAIGVTLKLYWHRLIALFRRQPEQEVENNRMETGKNTAPNQEKPDA